MRVITLTTRRMDNSQLDSTDAHMRVRTLVVLSCRFSKNLKIHTDPLCLNASLESLRYLPYVRKYSYVSNYANAGAYVRTYICDRI